MTRFLIVLFLTLSLSIKSQITEVGLGGGGMFNFQTSSIGLGVRGYIGILDHFALVPKFNYYLPINPVHEYYLGADVQIKFNPYHEWHFYALGDFLYHRWMNYENFMPPLAQPNSFVIEPGIGLMKTYDCVRPYIEGRYDSKWKEASLHVGILFFFQDCGGGEYVCPAYR